MNEFEQMSEGNQIEIIEAQIQKLTDDDWVVRLSAARFLGKTRNPEAVEPLIKILKDNNPAVRKAAVESLNKLRDPRAIEPLMACANDTDKWIRLEVMKGLSELGGPLAKSVLIEAASDENLNVRRYAIEALKRSFQIQCKALEKQSKVPILDYVVLADLHGVVRDVYEYKVQEDFFDRVQSFRSSAIRGYLFSGVIEIKDNEGGFMYVVFGIAETDDSADWKADGQTISIHSKERSGLICPSEMYLVGIATYNEKAIENEWVTKWHWLYQDRQRKFGTINVIKTPNIKLGKATKFHMKEYDGNMEFWFDAPHGVVKDWMSYYHFQDGKISKYWRIFLQGTVGKTYTVNYKGTETKYEWVIEEFDSEESARKAVNKLCKTWEENGYVNETIHNLFVPIKK